MLQVKQLILDFETKESSACSKQGWGGNITADMSFKQVMRRLELLEQKEEQMRAYFEPIS